MKSHIGSYNAGAGVYDINQKQKNKIFQNMKEKMNPLGAGNHSSFNCFLENTYLIKISVF